MVTTVTTYVQPITQPLQDLQGSFTQLAAQHRAINSQLRKHATDLLSGPMNFQGSGAQAFSSMVDCYLDASEKHMQCFDDAAGAVQTCHSDISYATESAAGAGLHPGLTSHVLSQVSHNEIIQNGSAPIWSVVNDLMRTLGDMAHQGGSFLGDIFTGNFSGAWDALKQEWGDLKNLGSDAMSLVQDIGHVLGSWAEAVCGAIKKCLSFIGSITLKVADFVTGFSSIVNDIKTIFSGKASLWQKLTAAGDLVLNVGMDVSMLFGVGEALKGGELLLKGGVGLAERLGQEGGIDLVEKEAGKLTDQGARDLSKDGLGNVPDANMPAAGQQESQALLSGDPISSIRQELEQTPRGREALAIQQKYNVPVEWGKPGRGTFYNPKLRNVEMDPTRPADRQAAEFVHEMGHAEYGYTGKSVNFKEKIAKLSREDYVKGMLHEEVNGQVRAIEFVKQGGNKLRPAVCTDAYDKGYQQAVDAFKAQHPAATPAELDQAGKQGAFQSVYDAWKQIKPSNAPSMTYPEYYGQAWDRWQAYFDKFGRP